MRSIIKTNAAVKFLARVGSSKLIVSFGTFCVVIFSDELRMSDRKTATSICWRYKKRDFVNYFFILNCGQKSKISCRANNL